MILAALACANSTHAQVTTGTVRGVVTDQNGAVVPNATVSITDPKTKNTQTAQSGSQGDYQFNNLLAGTYVITVQPPPDSNFSALTLNDVRVKLNEVTDVPGSVNGVEPIATTGVGQINTVGQSDFNVPSHVFSSHPRVIQLAVRFDF